MVAIGVGAADAVSVCELESVTDELPSDTVDTVEDACRAPCRAPYAAKALSTDAAARRKSEKGPGACIPYVLPFLFVACRNKPFLFLHKERAGEIGYGHCSSPGGRLSTLRGLREKKS